MCRRRARSALPPLDAADAERMLDGAVVDVPDSYRRVAALLADASGPASPHDLDGAAVAAAAFVVTHEAANRPAPRTRPKVAMAITAVLLAACTGTALAATDGALPEPAQAVAHETLGVVGIRVPGITPQRPDAGSRHAASGRSTTWTDILGLVEPSGAMPVAVDPATATQR